MVCVRSFIFVFVTCCFMLCGGTACAQYNDLQDISSSEASKMFKNYNGLMSATEMQAYEKGLLSQSDSAKIKKVVNKQKTTKKK